MRLYEIYKKKVGTAKAVGKGAKEMKKYVFEEYSDRKGIGTLKMFDSKKEAVEYAKESWNRLVKSDKEKIDKYHVYEVEMTDEQLADYENGTEEFIFDDLWTADVWDVMQGEANE